MQLNIGQRSDPVDQIARHRRFQARSPYDEMQAFYLRCEKHHGLSRRITSAHERHLLAFAELRLHRRSPKRNTPTLEGREVRDCRSPVAGAGGDNGGSGAHHAVIGELQPHGFACFLWVALEPRYLKRNRNLDAKLQRLIEGAACEPHAGDASWKAKIVLDPRRRACLSAERPLIKHENREALRPGIDGGGEARGSSADDGHIIDSLRVELGGDAEIDAGFSIRRPLQYRPVRTDHEWQLLGEHARALDHGAAFWVVGGVEHRVGIAIATEKALKTYKVRRARLSDEY